VSISISIDFSGITEFKIFYQILVLFLYKVNINCKDSYGLIHWVTIF